MQLPDLNLLIALDALLDEGSVVGAARRMHLSPAAMSRTLTRIREATGDPVLVRAGRGLVPTPRALAMQAQVRELVEQAAQVFQARDEVDMRTLERCFNVRSNDVFFGSFGARVLRRFASVRPAALCGSCPKEPTTMMRCAKAGSTCTSRHGSISVRRSRFRTCSTPGFAVWPVKGIPSSTG